jgi:hypothetical protein
MPAVSEAQRKAMAIAEHHPDKLYKKNKGLLKMSKKQLSDYASTPSKDLPEHVNAIRALVDGDADVARKIAKRKRVG